MLRQIINAFRHKDVPTELDDQIGNMLDAGAWMFDQACDVLMRKVDAADISDALYKRDQQINHLEQQIRERIVTHLSVGNQGDLAPCLILMSVVKDAERIGDYCKNIFEVGKFYQGTFEHRTFSEPLTQIRDDVAQLFEPTKHAFVDTDEAAAKKVIDQSGAIVKRCDLLIQQLLSLDEELPPAEAVAYVLLARHYKRVNSHLSNIATGVSSPIPLLDYLDEG